MVRKANPSRVWQNKKQNLRHQQNRATNLPNEALNNFEERNQSENAQEDMKMQEKNDEECVLPAIFQEQQQKFTLTQNKKELSTHFKVTSELINLLNEKAYKQIVLPQFIQTSLNPQLLANLNSFQNSQLHYQAPFFAVRTQQNQQIDNFIFGSSLELPSVLRPFKTSRCRESKLIEKSKPQINFLQITWKKHKALSFFDTTLLELSYIKYLNIYGPTGSGKTFTLNSIIDRNKFQQNVIWINGMNIISGKTKKFISDLESKFYNTFWQFYNVQSQKDNFSLEKFTNSCFSKTNEKVLILDEYDQINDFEIRDLLRYAYIKGLENYPTQSRKLFRISKVIFVSNNFEPTQTFMHKEGTNFISNKILYMQHLIFKPFTQNQAFHILLEKIQCVNRNFVSAFDESIEIKGVFSKEMKGIFQDQSLMHIIKKVSTSQQIDIRKIQQFYANSFKKWIQSLDQLVSNFILDKKGDKGMTPKVQSFLVEKKFLEKCSLYTLNSQRPRFQSEDDSNPMFFYLSQIEFEGRIILKAICEILKFKKKLLGTQTTKYAKQTQNQSKNTIQKVDASQLLASNKRRQNTARIMDFFVKIRPKIQLYQVYPWLYQWQEMGLIKIRKGISEKTLEAEVGICQTNKITIIDNLLIEVLNIKAIQQALDLYY